MRGSPRTKRTLALAALALAACAPMATVNQQSEEAAIRSIGQDWQRAIAARDVNRILSYHAADVVINNPNTPAISGTTAATTAWTEVTNLPGLSLTWTPARIEVVNPTTAIENGSWRMSFNGPSGPVSDSGDYITVWRKIDGQWRVSRDATMSTKPR